MEQIEYKCKYCGKICKNKNSLAQHEIRCKLNENRLISSFEVYNKIPHNRIYKNEIYECKYCSRICKNKSGLSWHEGYCKLNPNKREISNETRERMSLASTGRKYTQSFKDKISESMKKAHAEGRAHNIGQSRWNNEQSYPEKFFTKVIENEFEDKNYKTEYPLGIYALDFAWVDKKKAIEIDGEQHQRFQEYIDRDKRKDQYLKEQGWKCLRIPWKLIYNDPKYWIEVTKNFIHNDNYICPIIEFNEENLPIFDKKYFKKKKINEDQIEKEKQMVEDLINNSNIDFNILGWKQKSCEYLNISPKILYKILNLYNKEFYDKCFSIKTSDRYTSETNINEKIRVILESNIDFSKIGWSGKVAKLVNILPSKVTYWMQKYMKDFYLMNCKIRKGTIIN